MIRIGMAARRPGTRKAMRLMPIILTAGAVLIGAAPAAESGQPPYRGGAYRAAPQPGSMAMPRSGLSMFGGASAFLPESDLFSDNEFDFGTSSRDLVGSRWGLEYHFAPIPNVEILAGVENGSRDFFSSYIDYVFENGGEIEHYTSYSFTDLTLGARVRMAPGSTFSPYLTGGFSGSFYRYQESGDFVDFTSPAQDIVYDEYEESSFLPGFFVGAGADYAFSLNFSVFGEWRLQYAEKAHEDDFAGYGDFRALRNGGAIGLRLRF